MKAQEQKLLDELEKFGLVRDVHHDIFDWPVSLDANYEHKHPRHIIGETTVRLYEKKVVAEKGWNADAVVVWASSHCSELEGHYNKQKGRLIATGRALKKFKETLI